MNELTWLMAVAAALVVLGVALTVRGRTARRRIARETCGFCAARPGRRHAADCHADPACPVCAPLSAYARKRAADRRRGGYSPAPRCAAHQLPSPAAANQRRVVEP